MKSLAPFDSLTETVSIYTSLLFHDIPFIMNKIQPADYGLELFFINSRNTKFNVRPKLCHICKLNSQAFGALLLSQALLYRLTKKQRSETCELSRLWHNFGWTLNLMFLSISWIFFPSATGATSYFSLMKFKSCSIETYDIYGWATSVHRRQFRLVPFHHSNIIEIGLSNTWHQSGRFWDV